MHPVKITLPTLVALSTLTLGCVQDSQPDETFRVLPVAAVMQDGGEVLVGTYDEATRELDLVPTFVEEFEALADGTLYLKGRAVGAPFGTQAVWADELGEGSNLSIVLRDETDQYLDSGELVIHAEEWTDSLTEAEAGSSFAACFDPEPGGCPPAEEAEACCMNSCCPIAAECCVGIPLGGPQALCKPWPE